MAVLQFMPGSPSVLISYTGTKRRIQHIFLNSGLAFSQDTFQLMNASIRTFWNNNMMKIQASETWATTCTLIKEDSFYRESKLF